ncbi:DUF732 domain-containing protein [Streptomyces griseorubiginosus]|uniref:DUF732 domain-containing protein n=1 Tax=Streptomyces griseorubiginosus TaxID=67304 RepID=UPI00369B0D7A
MRHIAIGAAAAAVLLVLTGCSSSSGPSEQDKRYAAAVAAADPKFFGGFPVDKLASTLGSEGRDLCDQLKKGSYEDAVAYAKLGYDSAASAALVAAAVPVYCPDQKSKLPAAG